jgi:uncharacterized membrane-anchored protein
MTDAAWTPGRLPGGLSARAVKVPAATALFWTIKILTTGMGETTSDYLVGAFDPHLAVLGGGAVLGAVLLVQWLWPRYSAPVYWIAVLTVAVVGTMLADIVHTVLHVPYAISSIAFALALVLAFWVWHRTEGTLSIHSIRSRRAEAFYWSVVMLTFALGTALGDLTAHGLGLGYFLSAIGYGALLVLPLVAWHRSLLGEVAAFWAAYVMTRPFGASIADWLGAPAARGGLGFGFGPVSAVLAVGFVLLVARAARSGDGREA